MTRFIWRMNRRRLELSEHIVSLGFIDELAKCE